MPEVAGGELPTLNLYGSLLQILILLPCECVQLFRRRADSTFCGVGVPTLQEFAIGKGHRPNGRVAVQSALHQFVRQLDCSERVGLG